METRVFRQASCGAVAGGFLALVGGILLGITSYHLATGIPLWQADSKYHAGEHIASSGELWFGIVGGTPLLLFGVVVILSTLNCAVTIDEEGISATNLLKYKFFRAAWSEIVTLEPIGPKPGSGYRLSANGKTLKIQTSLPNMKELIAEIQRQAPGLSRA